MKIIHDAIRFPVTTAVGVILLVLFGSIALTRIPVQLTPNVEKPEITVSTIWPGASPQEIEREIVDEQEEQLKSLAGLTKMESSSSDSRGSITLTFQIGTDIDSALLKVSNRLEQVPSYPDDANKPVIRSVNIEASAIAWFALIPTEENGFEGDITTLFDFIDEFIKPEFERVPGVAASNIYGGREREMHVIFDPARLAARRVTLNQLGAALERENRNYSGGDFDEGKRRYIVRTVGEYQSPEDIENIVVAVRNGVPIYLKDAARVELGYRKPGARVFQKGLLIMAMNAVKEPGSNILQVMTDLKQTVARLNADLLHTRGLHLIQVYDETDYIESAIALVRQSLFIGGFLAIVILLLFLRSGTSTLVIAVAIPISIIGTFLMMTWFDRTLNVISLAGMAFAVGMVVDNSIVVLENIYRHSQMGKPRFTAAYDGAREVWGAVLASTLTTIAVFVPVVFIQEEAGQLFGDIAIAISCAVALSLLVAITVIPSLSAKILRAVEHKPDERGYHNLWGFLRLTRGFTHGVTSTVDWINTSTARRLAVILTLTTASIGLSVLLMPKTEYLPVGNQNFLFGLILPPPGYNLDEVGKLYQIYDKELSPLWQAEPGSPEAQALPGGGIRTFFFGTSSGFVFMGARANDPMRVRELIPEFQRANAQIPGAIAIINQASIFQRGRGEGRNIDVEITGPELERLIALGAEIFQNVMQKMPEAQARPIPSLDLGNPEVQVRTHRRRAAELGISNRDLGFAVSALVDGVKASDYQYEGREIDLKVMAEKSFAHRTHLLEQMPIATPDGRLVTLGSVADISVVTGPTQINHSERQRTITIQVTPPEQMPLEAAMDLISNEIVGPLRESGQLGGLYRATLSGSADKLTQTGRSLQWNILLALVITYLLMAALFESFLYPFVIMFSVPLAALGGFLGLAVVNLFTYQALDVLTMLGFIILVGTVVNNAILIVHQSLNHMREEGLEPREAIREAVGNRIRPIFMSVSTSVFAMMPLVLFPGAGSELYRGLGSVVVGGLVVSTIFTLFLVPALFSLTLDIRAALSARLHGLLHPAEHPTADD
ncbi:MAG: efflux RND transporter permease subunit [Acidobacteria bacterium]|nr:efflux RND transporter permease subunit [Acidobacteriota bacterium]